MSFHQSVLRSVFNNETANAYSPTLRLAREAGWCNAALIPSTSSSSELAEAEENFQLWWYNFPEDAKVSVLLALALGYPPHSLTWLMGEDEVAKSVGGPDHYGAWVEENGEREYDPTHGLYFPRGSEVLHKVPATCPVVTYIRINKKSKASVKTKVMQFFRFDPLFDKTVYMELLNSLENFLLFQPEGSQPSLVLTGPRIAFHGTLAEVVCNAIIDQDPLGHLNALVRTRHLTRRIGG